MTDNNHPITPPPELVNKWCYEDGEEIKSSPRWFLSVCAKAAQWGADQELEACCEWLESEPDPGHVDLLRSCATALRAARRPKPPSLKAQALEALRDATGSDYPHPMTVLNAEQHSLICRALETLPDD
jgi:hypothetical protein